MQTRKPKLLLKDYHIERRELSQAFRKTGQTSMRTRDSRTISLIHWNPKLQCYEDHRNRFRIVRTDTHIQLFRLLNSGAMEKIPMATSTIQQIKETDTTKQFPLNRKTKLSGKIVFLNNVGYSNQENLERKAGRGVMIAFLDFLKRQGVAKVALNPSDNAIKKYYESLGFRFNAKEDWHELTL